MGRWIQNRRGILRNVPRIPVKKEEKINGKSKKFKCLEMVMLYYDTNTSCYFAGLVSFT